MKGLRFLVSLVAFLLVMPLIPTNAATFSDVTRYEKEINYLVDEGILNGYQDGTFKPRRNINRLQGVRILLKAKGVTDYDAPNPNFTDVTPTTHGYEEIAKAVDLGIISGKKNADGSKYFDANAPLTRGQMAKILVETMDLPIDRSFTFRDVPTSNGYFPYVSTLAAEQITEGYLDLTFKPNQPISRQHFSLFVARLLEDDFKPEVNKDSYASNRELIYTFRDDSGRTFQKRFLRTQQIGNIKSELWKYSGSALDRDRTLYEWEDHSGLHWVENLDSGYDTTLHYPLYVGQEFLDFYGDPSGIVVTDMGLTLTTRAGTFYNVTVVTSSGGYTTYYAPGYGAIKTVRYGTTTNELINLKVK